MNDQAFLSVFTPSRTAPEDLESIFVQRQAMLADAVERVRESATTGNKHHLLFVGPRGTGKTHLVTLLVHRLGQDSELKDRLHIAWLNEDETSTTLLEFLRRIYLALVKRYPDDYSETSLEPIYDLDMDTAERWLADLLLQQLKDRTLLVAVENLDALFEGLGNSGQQRLRAFIQEHPVLTIVATAQRLVDDIAKRNNAFFGFFQTEPLEMLSVEQAAELLSKIAAMNRQPEAAAFLRSPTGRSRIRALHHLSGGNHRIYIVLSQFISRDNVDALVGPFSKMIDEMTPYYQERIRWLPAQQRKIIEYLCTCERPVPVKDLARRLFASQQTISSQLKDLRDKGYVQSSQRGRESLYEIAEPLMRICVEVKENQSSEPMRLLVDFLRVWYDAPDLSFKLQGCDDGSVARTYLQAAIERNSTLGNLRAQLVVDDFRSELGDEQGSDWLMLIESFVGESEELALACGEWKKGNKEIALNILAEITGKSSEHSSRVISFAWWLTAEIHREQGKSEWVIKAIDSLLKMQKLPVEFIAEALHMRSMAYDDLGDCMRAIKDYNAIIGLTGIPARHIARAFYNRGLTYEQLGEFDKVISDFSAVIDKFDVPVERLTQAFIHRGQAHEQLGDLEKAISDYSVVISLPDAPVEDIATAFLHQGLTHWRLNDTEKEIADYSAVIGLPNAPAEAIAKALLIRGSAHERLDDTEKAIADYTAVIGLPDVSIEVVAAALLNRGIAHGQINDTEKEIADYSAVIGLPNAPAEAIAKALYIRGLLYWQMDDMANAEQDFEAIVRLADASIELCVDAYLVLAEIRIATGRWAAATAMLSEALVQGNSGETIYSGDSTNIISVLFQSSLTPSVRRERIIELAQIYQKHNAIPQLGEALTRHLGFLHRAEEGLPASDNLEHWATAWEEAGRDIEAFRLPLRIFRTGIDFLKSGGKDRSILLDLNQEERKILEQVFALDTE
jgi:tetratricopeptide (TPR) repeat protein/DNA-binding transcriptional ArsR family regulator